MTALQPGQLEIDGLRLGRGTPYLITDFSPGGKPDATTNDRRVPSADGRIMGRDTLDGRTISLGFVVDLYDTVAASRAYNDLARVWNAARARGEDGVYVPLRMRPFLEVPTRMVWGRPRKFDPVNEWLLEHGSVEVVADFDTIDPLFYSDLDDVEPLTIPIVAPQTGGWAAPFTAPVIVATTASGFGDFTVEGYEPTPLIARLHGPITNPIIDVLGLWRAQLATTLLYDQWVDIDARPWVRSVRRSDGANLGGALTAASPALSDLVLPPGAHEVVLRGIDPTGTSYLTLAWQGAGDTPYWI